MDTLSVGKWDYGILTFLVWIDLVFLWNDAKNAGPNFRKNPNWEWKTSWPAGHWRHIPRPMVIVTTWPAALTLALALDLTHSIANYVTLNWKNNLNRDRRVLHLKGRGRLSCLSNHLIHFSNRLPPLTTITKLKKKKYKKKNLQKTMTPDANAAVGTCSEIGKSIDWH